MDLPRPLQQLRPRAAQHSQFLKHRAGCLSPGHPSDRCRFEPWKIAVQGARRASRSDGAAGAALDGDLARLKTGAPGGWPPLSLAHPR